MLADGRRNVKTTQFCMGFGWSLLKLKKVFILCCKMWNISSLLLCGVCQENFLKTILIIFNVTMVTVLLVFSLQLNWSLSGRHCVFLVRTCKDSPVCPAQMSSSCSPPQPPPAEDTLQSKVRSVMMQSDWMSESDVTVWINLCVCVCSPRAPSWRVSQVGVRPQT